MKMMLSVFAIFFVLMSMGLQLRCDYKNHHNVQICSVVQVEDVNCYVRGEGKFEVKGCSMLLDNKVRTNVDFLVFKGDSIQYCTNSEFNPTFKLIEK